MTKFEIAQQDVKEGKITTPSVVLGDIGADYFGYQLTVHHFNLKLMAKGMKFRSITFSQIKDYYGLRGRGAADCLDQFEKILADYREKRTAQPA